MNKKMYDKMLGHLITAQTELDRIITKSEHEWLIWHQLNDLIKEVKKARG